MSENMTDLFKKANYQRPNLINMNQLVDMYSTLANQGQSLNYQNFDLD